MLEFDATFRSFTHKFHPLTTACVMPMPKSKPMRCSTVMMMTLPRRISGPTGNTLLRSEFRNLRRQKYASVDYNLQIRGFLQMVKKVGRRLRG